MAMKLVAAMALLGFAGSALAQGPVNWWRFDEAGGTTAFDSAGSANGTLGGNAVFVNPSVSGRSLDVTNFGWADMGSILPLTSGAFSFQAWVRTTNTSSNSTVIAGRHITGTFNGYMLRANQDTASYGAPGAASFYQSNSPANTVVGSSNIADGNWHHVLATYTPGGTANLYVDGSLQASLASQPIIANSANFIVGGVFFTPSSAVVGTFSGLIDDVQVYDYALTQAQVTFLFNNPGAAVPAPGVAGLIALAGITSARRRR